MRRNSLDGIPVETTDLADPAPAAQTFFVDEDARSATSLDVVTVAGAKHLVARSIRSMRRKSRSLSPIFSS